MSSTYTLFPSQFFDGSPPDRMHEQMTISPPTNDQHALSSTPADASNLSPFSSSQLQSNSASPSFYNTNPSDQSTPASLQYQSSDLESSELNGGDPFLGIDFNNLNGGAPSFLGDFDGAGNGLAGLGDDPFTHHITPAQSYNTVDTGGQGYLLSPEQSPSLSTTSPLGDKQGQTGSLQTVSVLYEPVFMPTPVSAPAPADGLKQGEQNQFPPLQQALQYTPDTTDSIPSSDDGLGPSIPAMSTPSPRVTVSLWGRDEGEEMSNVQNIEAAIHMDSGAIVPPVGASYFAPSHTLTSGVEVPRHGTVRRVSDPSASRRTLGLGLDPDSRPKGETTSINDLAASRTAQERNEEVDQWLSSQTYGTFPASLHDPNTPENTRAFPESQGVPDREILPGHQTENVMKAGQTYYGGLGYCLTQKDVEILRAGRGWDDTPVLPGIFSPKDGTDRYQPQTSTAAMEKFESMCRDNDSIVSRAATWGTRRRSLPSIIDIEAITSGNFLKKLSISRGEPRKPAIFFKELRGLVRKPSASKLANLKRSLSSQDEDVLGSGSGTGAADPTGERRESRDSLAPPGRTMSWGKKPTPSINTALVSMGSNIASIGTTHARSGSISTTTPVTSPRSPFTLKVANPLQRRRSKSELPRLGTDNSLSNLTDMWKRSGGPPVASLAKPGVANVDQEEDDDDDEELEDSEMKLEANKLIDDITPNFAGFQQHILKLNPMLAEKNTYLVDRIAHQQIIRYKSMLTARVKHMGHVQNKNCQCGSMCIALGGSATVYDSNGDARGMDPLSARIEGSDGDNTPLEGAIAPESFPQDIPMPPTQSLPAEFECQLCFQAKKFQKPSDWTKHVHEDVQPFTCTWDRCRDPKIFKRKADWVRHENEGHRHLEWWTCDVEDCRHTCYRRDNFLQHLVREHKFAEPKVKTKAAIKRSGATDPTWQKVERCHAETQIRPQEEECRFCGKTFPTWKKLTVHLAKHMEQISLPILRLVARKDLDADTIISPVQEPPQRVFAPLPVVKQDLPQPAPSQQPFGQSQNAPHNARHSPGSHMYSMPTGSFAYPVTSTGGGQFVSPQYHTHPSSYSGLAASHGMHNIDTAVMDMPHVNPTASYHQAAQQPYHPLDMPVTTGTYVAVTAPHAYMPVSASGLEPFPQLPMNTPVNALGLQDSTDAGGQLQYDGLMDPSGAVGGGGAAPIHFTTQASASASPYARSPHQPAGNFY